MTDDNATKNAFLNRRDWASYLRALQTVAAHPKVVGVVNSGRAWFTDGASQASGWFAGTGQLADKATAG